MTTLIINNPLEKISDTDWQNFLNLTKNYPTNLIYIYPHSINSVIVTDEIKENNKYSHCAIQREYINIIDLLLLSRSCMSEFSFYTEDFIFEREEEFINTLSNICNDIEGVLNNSTLDTIDSHYNVKKKAIKQEVNKEVKSESLLKIKPKFTFTSNTKNKPLNV